MAFTALPGAALRTDTGWLDFLTGEEGSALTLGDVLYTAADQAAWPGSGANYTAFIGSTFGSNSRSVNDWGTTGPTSDADNDDVIEDSVYARMQAIRWAANPAANAASKTKVIEILDGIKDITAIGGSAGQPVLDWAWSCINFMTAAAIIDYGAEAGAAALATMLEDVVLPMLHWTSTANWATVIGTARVAIGSYLQRLDLLLDGIDYTDYFLPRNIYVRSIDGDNIVPINGFGDWPALKDDLTPNESATETWWWGEVALTGGVYPASGLPDVCDAEVGRDIGHSHYTVVGYVQVCTILHNIGYAVPEEWIARIDGLVLFHAARAFTYLNTGSIPAGTSAPNAAEMEYGWRAVARWYELRGLSIPTDVAGCITESASSSWSGYQHMVADRFADGELLA